MLTEIQEVQNVTEREQGSGKHKVTELKEMIGQRHRGGTWRHRGIQRSSSWFEVFVLIRCLISPNVAKHLHFVPEVSWFV